MARRFTKDDVDFHSDGYGRKAHPAVNVKCYGYVNPDKIRDVFHCSEKTAEKAIEYAWNMNQETFWEDNTSKDELAYYFPDHHDHLKVYSEGRSGGWLVVDGLPPVEDWDAIMVSRWGRFERSLQADVKYRCSVEGLLDNIEANEWAIDNDSLLFEVNAGLDALVA